VSDIHVDKLSRFNYDESNEKVILGSKHLKGESMTPLKGLGRITNNRETKEITITFEYIQIINFEDQDPLE